MSKPDRVWSISDEGGGWGARLLWSHYVHCHRNPEFSDFEDIAELIIEAASDPSVEGDLAELFRRNMIETV